MKKCIKVTIDGPSASGKSTVAKMLARSLSFIHLDSGAIYRAIALYFQRENLLDLDEDLQKKALRRFTYYFSGSVDDKRHFLNGEDVTEAIRGRDISDVTSILSKKDFVRDFSTNLQRVLSEGENIVIEGRDTGSVVFPDAEVKFYLDAEPEERAKRRFLEMKWKEGCTGLTEGEIAEDLKIRDARDREREHSPLVVPKEAIIVDTTALSIKNIEKFLRKAVKAKAGSAGWKKPYRWSFHGKRCSIIYRMTKWFFTAYFRTFHTYRVYGRENFHKNAPAIIACNHVSLLDPPMLGCACEEVIHCLAKKALFRKKAIRYWLSKVNTYPVSGSSDDKEVMKKVVSLLLKGDKVLIFPEGTRSKDGSVAPLRKGLALFADKGRASVIPTAVIGPEEALPVHKKFPKLFTKLIVAFGPPVNFGDVLKEVGDKKRAREVFLERIQNEIQGLIDTYKLKK